MKNIQHGDVDIKPIQTLPKKLKKVEVKNSEFILAYGESTGHCHRLLGDFEILQNETGNYFIQVKGDCKIEHYNTITKSPAEHKPLPLEVGDYEVGREQDYSPFLEALTEVID